MPEPIVVDRGKCPRCGNRTRRGYLSDFNSHMLTVSPAREGSNPYSGIISKFDAYVCTACGHIEFFAQDLSVFRG